MSSAKGQPVRPEILDEAAGWLIEFRTGVASAEDRRKFDEWLRASPQHVRAYLEVLPVWESSARPESSGLPDAKTLIEWARGGNDNVVPLGAAPRGPEKTHSRRHRGRSLAIAASAAVVGVGVWTYMQRETYATDIGEQRAMTLTDGSTVQVNARSRIRVRFSEGERSVELLAGQALFRVASDKSRPFVVHSGAARIRAVGTQFDVYRKARGTQVTVIEGRVAVESSATKIPLSAGEQVNLQSAAPPQPVPANIPAAIAWTQQRLIFSGTPLTEVAEEFNRYNTRPLVIEDASLERVRLNGVFSSTNPTALLTFLREQEGLSVVETRGEIRVSHH